MGTGRITDPLNREEFGLYIRSKLGEPIIEINVTDFQVDQVIDECLQYYRDYHYNGTTREYFAHKVTEADRTNGYLTLPSEIIGVTNVYDAQTDSEGIGIANPYSVTWRLNYDLIFNYTNGLSTGIQSYYILKTYYDLLNQILVAYPNLRYNMMNDKLYIDSQVLKVDSNIVVDCYRLLDPDEYPQVWSDRWLIRYAVAKLKLQWGENMGKYSGYILPGGGTPDYPRLINEALEEIKDIEERCLADYSIPPRDLVG